jgi:hypothetical protein
MDKLLEIAKRLQPIGCSRPAADWIDDILFPTGAEIPATGRTMVVYGAMHPAGHTASQSRTAFAAGFRAPHGATGLTDFYGILDRHTAIAAFIGFALVEHHLIERTTGATA